MTNHFAPTVARLPAASRFDAMPLICVTALAGVPDFVRHAYGETLLRRATRAAMLDIEAIENRDCFIPHATMTLFSGAVARFAGEEYFGLLLAPYLTIASYGCWGDYLLAAPTLGAALERAIATIGFHSRGDVVGLRIEDKLARITYSSAARGRDGYAQVACGAAGVVLSLCRAFLPPAWRPLRLELDLPRPQRTTTFEETFGCPVLFDAPTVALCLDRRWLDALPLARRTSALITVEDIARARTDCTKLSGLRDLLAEQIWSQVLSGKVSIESAARSLDISVRTLQRELNREGTDFRTLTGIVRGRRATELLRHTEASVTEISASFGYSAPAHFARSFRKATGLSPLEYRRMTRGRRGEAH